MQLTARSCPNSRARSPLSFSVRASGHNPAGHDQEVVFGLAFDARFLEGAFRAVRFGSFALAGATPFLLPLACAFDEVLRTGGTMGFSAWCRAKFKKVSTP